MSWLLLFLSVWVASILAGFTVGILLEGAEGMVKGIVVGGFTAGVMVLPLWAVMNVIGHFFAPPPFWVAAAIVVPVTTAVLLIRRGG